jgi:D-arabinitol dehydrogenase (NADP+)
VKAVRYAAATQFRLVEIDEPVPGPGEVVIEVALAGLCGTDLHLHHGDFNAVFPMIPGHEVVGSVSARGRDATRFQVGEQVTVNPNVHCGYCQYCLAGRLILCENARAFGVSEPGFFAEYACVPEAQVFSVNGLPADTAVFAEPTACAMHGLETLQVRPGSSALVLGAGPTGVLLAQLLSTGGASSVTVAGPTGFKLETAAALGADRTVLIDRTDAAGNASNLRRQSPGGDGYDIVIEATGATSVGDICVPLTRNGGTVLVYGVTRAAEMLQISPFDVFRREITIRGSFAEMTSFGAAIAALRGGRVRTDGIITHRIPLVDYGVALDALRSDPIVHKVVLVG